MEFQSYLSQKYQGHESFLENIIFPIFGEDNYETSYDVELLDSEELRGQAARTGIRSIIRCGTIDIDLTPIEVFDITVSDRLMMDKNRVGVQAVIRRVMDTYSGAFMIIHYDNDVKWDWRFTFCQMKDKGEFSDNKRYTFLLGPNQSCRTAAQNFQKLADLHEDITIKDIVSAFDVEALSKSFFDGYKKHYERFVEFITGKRFVKEAGKFIEKTSHDPHSEYYPAFGNDDKAVRDYTKLLLARIVFLHFLQKKGWLGVPVGGKWGDGDEQFMKHLYEKASEEQKNDYLESVLEPLFFDALNGDRTSSKDVFDTKVVGKVRIPYLNGGLFSRDSLDDVVIRYPKEFFGDFLEFLYQYNFTIDENDPNEAQVGIDPEMLGKIFENLLEDNKDKGAFYTPKEIVQYMCQESLIACLNTKTGLDEERLRLFVKDPFVRVAEFTPDEQYSILGAILTVKICDPAIGSGAFPIGLLNELVRCKEAIYGDEKGRAEIKKEIIRDNIYGVDIEKGAVDIARLRFWLSLIVDEEEPLPLPNLDYKIMQGNSLLEWYDGVDLSHLVETAVFGDMFGGGRAEILKESLSKLLKEYFDESVQAQKYTLKESIKQIISEILDIAGVEIPDSIDISENNQFFLWHTWFNDVFAEDGFDIVIGNPPYIQLQADGGKLGKMYQGHGFQSFISSGDIYCLFYEQGSRLLKQNGHLCFISSNKWMRAAYGERLRTILSDHVNTILLIDFAGLKIFENASVDTNILLFKKSPSSHNTYSVVADKEEEDTSILSHLSDYVQHKGTVCEFRGGDSWVILSPLEQSVKRKIETRGIQLKDWDVSIYRGILTGLNEAFIISTEKRDELLADCKTEDERVRTERLIRPVLRGRDIKRYGYDWAGIWQINTHNGVKGRIPRINIDDYPTVKKYLNGFGEALTSRSDKGDTPYNLRNCAYVEAFSEPKLIWSETMRIHKNSVGRFPRFSYSEEEILTDKTCFIATGENLKWILAILNSKLGHYMCSKYVTILDNGGYLMQKIFIEQIPIAPYRPEISDRIIPFVNHLLDSNETPETSVCEDELDKIVYDLYNLSKQEVAFIEKCLNVIRDSVKTRGRQ